MPDFFPRICGAPLLTSHVAFGRCREANVAPPGGLCLGASRAHARGVLHLTTSNHNPNFEVTIAQSLNPPLLFESLIVLLLLTILKFINPMISFEVCVCTLLLVLSLIFSQLYN